MASRKKDRGSNTKTKFGMWGLVLINLAALGGVRAWAPMAACGASAIFFLTLGTLAFFLPLALIVAELATAWPQSGGVYGWVKEAFGHKWGFLAAWLLWIENVIWYPTILAFIASTLSFLIDPALADNRYYMIALILVVFWGTTLASFRGLKASKLFSSIGAICGTFIPSALLIGLGLSWFLGKGETSSLITAHSVFPDMTSFAQLALFGGVMISLVGIEMSGVYAAEVENPKKAYPKAIFFSALLVIFLSFFGVLSIALVVPQSELILSAGVLQAFTFFAKQFHLQAFLPLIALIVALGALGSMSTWVIGPCKGLLAASKESDLPPLLRQENQHGSPKNILLFQAGIVTGLSFLFLFMPTVNNAYWALLILTTQLYLVMYFLLFAAAIRLRSLQPDHPRPFRVPGGRFGMWLLGGLGILFSLFAFVISFVPPVGQEQLHAGLYALALALAIIFLSLLPFLWMKLRRKR